MWWVVNVNPIELSETSLSYRCQQSVVTSTEIFLVRAVIDEYNQ